MSTRLLSSNKCRLVDTLFRGLENSRLSLLRVPSSFISQLESPYPRATVHSVRHIVLAWVGDKCSPDMLTWCIIQSIVTHLLSNPLHGKHHFPVGALMINTANPSRKVRYKSSRSGSNVRSWRLVIYPPSPQTRRRVFPERGLRAPVCQSNSCWSGAIEFLNGVRRGLLPLEWCFERYSSYRWAQRPSRHSAGTQYPWKAQVFDTEDVKSCRAFLKNGRRTG